MSVNARGQLALHIWTALFFVSFGLVMWSWKWEIAPLAKAAGTFGGLGLMVICYRFGIDRCLRRLSDS